jgi:uncharacterized protein YbjQ (UPF0145 family)
MKALNLKNLFFTSVLISTLILSGCGANTGLKGYNINHAMNDMPTSVKSRTNDFKFYFGKDSTIDTFGAKKLGKVKTSNRTNSAGKSALKACNWVFYSALLDLKQQAESMGGNAVTNIQSNWKGNTTSSSTKYMCANGLWLSGVSLTGTAIKE